MVRANSILQPFHVFRGLLRIFCNPVMKRVNFYGRRIEDLRGADWGRVIQFEILSRRAISDFQDLEEHVFEGRKPPGELLDSRRFSVLREMLKFVLDQIERQSFVAAKRGKSREVCLERENDTGLSSMLPVDTADSRQEFWGAVRAMGGNKIRNVRCFAARSPEGVELLEDF